MIIMQNKVRTHLPVVYMSAGAVLQFLGLSAAAAYASDLAAYASNDNLYVQPGSGTLLLGLLFGLIGMAFFLVGIVAQGVKVGQHAAEEPEDHKVKEEVGS